MKLDYKKTILLGLAFMSISSFWQMYDNIVPLILTNSFHLGETMTGTIMALDNLLALFLLPFFGTLSDRVETRLGKRTPFIIVGTVVAVTAMMLLPYSDNTNNFVLFIISLGVVLLAMGFYRSPAVALMPDLTPKPLRSKANAVINLMGALGGIYSLIMIKVLVKGGATPNYFNLFISVALFMILAVVVLVVAIPENKLRKEIAELYPEEEIVIEEVTDNKKSAPLPKDVKRSLVFILCSIFLWFTAYNAVTTAFSRYATNVWMMENGGYANCLMVATVAAIISYIPIGHISAKIGRKKTIMLGLLLLGSCFFAVGIMDGYHPIVNVGFALVGIGWAAIGVNSLPMVVEMASNSDVGKYTGLYYTFSMSAQILTPIASGYLLEHVSYSTLFPYAVFFTFAAICTMSQVKHGDSKPEAKKDFLENFDIYD